MPLYFTDRKSESPDGKDCLRSHGRSHGRSRTELGPELGPGLSPSSAAPLPLFPAPLVLLSLSTCIFMVSRWDLGWVLAVSVEYTASQSTMPRQCRVPAYYDFGDLAWVPPSQEAQGLALLSQAG